MNFLAEKSRENFRSFKGDKQERLFCPRIEIWIFHIPPPLLFYFSCLRRKKESEINPLKIWPKEKRRGNLFSIFGALEEEKKKQEEVTKSANVKHQSRP
jgi:hypothetical protein